MADEKKPIEHMTDAEIQRENSKLQLEMTRLQYEDLQYRLERERSQRAHQKLVHENQQRSMDDFNREVVLRQSWCKHKKGGKNADGVLKGTDPNYSIVVNTYPWGEVGVSCTRCSKDWRQPSEELKKEDKPAYARQLKEYKEALNWPTDNEPSGSQIFLITRNKPAA